MEGVIIDLEDLVGNNTNVVVKTRFGNVVYFLNSYGFTIADLGKKVRIVKEISSIDEMRYNLELVQ